MTYRVIILSQARGDIDRNAEWWADHHSLDEALRWSDRVYEQLGTLTLFPESHSLSAENDEFSYEIREKFVGLGSRPSYRAVFTIKEGTVYVLTVRRCSEDRLHSSGIIDPPSE